MKECARQPAETQKSIYKSCVLSRLSNHSGAQNTPNAQFLDAFPRCVFEKSCVFSKKVLSINGPLFTVNPKIKYQKYDFVKTPPKERVEKK